MASVKVRAITICYTSEQVPLNPTLPEIGEELPDPLCTIHYPGEEFHVPLLVANTLTLGGWAVRVEDV